MSENKAGIPLNAFSTDTSTTAKYKVGTVVRDKATNKVYKYIQVEDAALAIGDVVEYSDITGSEVTKDRSGGSSLGRIVAGVALGTIADGSYGWIQVAGLNTYVKTDGSVAAGEAIVPHASTDGVADSVVASTTAHQVFGYSLVADTTSASSAVMLKCAF